MLAGSLGASLQMTLMARLRDLALLQSCFFLQATGSVRINRETETMPNTETLNGGLTTSTDLAKAQEPEDLLQLLKDFGFNDQDIAEGTGTDPRTVRRWKIAAPGTLAAARLAEIRNIVLWLRDAHVLTDRGIVFWMRHRNRLLEDYSPMEVLGAGGFRAARGAALCFQDSERAFSEGVPASVLESLRRTERQKAQKGSKRAKASSSERRGKLEPVS